MVKRPPIIPGRQPGHVRPDGAANSRCVIEWIAWGDWEAPPTRMSYAGWRWRRGWSTTHDRFGKRQRRPEPHGSDGRGERGGAGARPGRRRALPAADAV